MLIPMFLVALIATPGNGFAKSVDYNELPEWKQSLLNDALNVKEHSYSPYSNYKVGAALLTIEGEVIVGTNVENASYGLTMCAERAALFSAIGQGKSNLKAIAVHTLDGGMPCGACRQILNEFNPSLLVISANYDHTEVHEYTLSELLPKSFGPANLR